MISAGFAHRRGTPCANGPRHHAHCTERIQSTALKILAGDVLKRLPTGPDVHTVAHLRIPSNSADLGIQKMWHEPRDCVRGYDSIGIDAHENFFILHVLQSEVEGIGLA